MRYRIITKWMRIFCGCLVAVTFSIAVARLAKAQSAFLISPYYGTTSVNQGYSSGHPAYDYNLSYTQVLAADAGTVTRVQWYDNRPECHGPTSSDYCGYGLHIYLQHSNGYVTRYAHLSSAAFALNSSGTSVQAGEIIGMSGNTGWSTGPHLHFEVKTSGGGNTDPNNPSLWKDGEWASQSRPIPAPVNGGEIIVDDTSDNSGGFRKGGGGYGQNQCTGNCQNWTAGTVGYSSDMYSTPADRNNNSVDQWAEWTPSGMPGEGAVYEVFVYVPNTNATSWQAKYVITHLNTSGNWATSAATVDQYGLSDQWVSIGAYRMKPGAYVWTHDATGESYAQHCVGNWCQLGVDGVKFIRRGTVYAPDVRYNNNWVSSVVVRNNGGGLATILVKFLKSDGVTTACSTGVPTLFAHQSISLSCSNTQVASVVVEASQDVSVVVVQEHSSPYTHEAYAGVDNPAAGVRAPIVHKNHSGWYSDLFVQNAGNVSTNINLEFYPIGGSCSPCTKNNVVTIGPNARENIQLANLTELASGFYGAVRVTNSANQPLAIASTQYYGTSLLMETSNTQPAAATLYAPLIQNYNSNWVSGLAVNRINGNNFTLAVYNSGSTTPCYQPAAITSNPWTQYPAVPGGTSCLTTALATFSANSNGTLVANVNQLQSTTSATTYAAVAAPAKTAIIAKAWRNSSWTDGFVVANFNGVGASVTVAFYKTDGSLNSTPVTYSVGAKGSLIIFAPTNFTGSAVVTADQPIAVSVNSLHTGSGDTIGSYPATHR